MIIESLLYLSQAKYVLDIPKSPETAIYQACTSRPAMFEPKKQPRTKTTEKSSSRG